MMFARVAMSKEDNVLSNEMVYVVYTQENQVIGIAGVQCRRSISSKFARDPINPTNSIVSPPQIRLYRRADLVPEPIATARAP
jgi:hypothetical protein